MMADNKKFIEFEGGTVEEAIKKALEFFKVPRNSISVKVVSEEQRGLFGMEGQKPAKIKVTLFGKSIDLDKDRKKK